jgi:hypothetical protein
MLPNGALRMGPTSTGDLSARTEQRPRKKHLREFITR